MNARSTLMPKPSATKWAAAMDIAINFKTRTQSRIMRGPTNNMSSKNLQ